MFLEFNFMVHIIYITLIVIASAVSFVAGIKNAESTQRKIKALLDEVSKK